MLVVALFTLSLCGCRRQEVPRLPPPVYEKPTLPSWEPPPEDQKIVPFDLEGMEGEIVADEEPAPAAPLQGSKPSERSESESEPESGPYGESDADGKAE